MNNLNYWNKLLTFLQCVIGINKNNNINKDKTSLHNLMKHLHYCHAPSSLLSVIGINKSNNNNKIHLINIKL